MIGTLGLKYNMEFLMFFVFPFHEARYCHYRALQVVHVCTNLTLAGHLATLAYPSSPQRITPSKEERRKVPMDKRIIAPAIFGTLALLVGAAYASVFLIFPIPLFFKVIIAAGILTLAGAMVYVIIQRKKELKEEDTDDLGKY
jgi:hypothetical protein